MRPSGWERVGRLLAVRLDNIGDVIMLGPALRTLRRALPDAHMALLASPAGAQAARLLPWLDDTIVERTLWQDASGRLALDPDREATLAGRLRAGRFDAAVVFTSFSQSPHPPAFVCYLAGIPLRIGQSKEFGGGVLTSWIRPPSDGLHQVDRNLWLLEQAGFEVDERRLELDIPRGDEDSATRLLEQSGIRPSSPFVVVAPGASCAARRYDAGRFGKLAGSLARTTSLPVVLAGSERETGLCERVLREAGSAGVRSIAGRTSLAGLAAVIRRAALVVANNSGPLHMADAFGVPMVVLYSGTELEEQWRPRTSPSVLLRRPTDCSPCYRFECPFGLECLDIPAGEVIGTCLAMLRRFAGANAHRAPGRSAAVPIGLGGQQ